ncbi:MAG: AraC family transcriptional regulator [Lysobacteraceae bacterium]|nr:MAG: AraC family transcriptional regulator [Xanthomonadaceae bacterium]
MRRSGVLYCSPMPDGCDDRLCAIDDAGGDARGERMNELLPALTGFSIGMAALLALAFATVWRGLALPWTATFAGYAMLAGLAFTAWQHLGLARLDPAAVPPRAYGVGLFLQSFAFYMLLRGLLRPDDAPHRGEALMLVGVIALATLTPPAWAIPLSLTMGAGFAMHLAVLLYRLRATRRWFRIELPVVALFGAMGMIVAVTGWLTPERVDWARYALIYATQIALGFALVGWLLWVVPDLVNKTREAVAASYAQSTLGKIDVDHALERLRRLFEDEHVYRDETLSLAKLAGLVELSPHQLSELINTRFGIGFSRYVRQQRVAAARRMLIDEPRASILSVGLSVGFGSQSTFYVAFKDEVGVVPGEYRKRQLEKSSAG